MGIGLSYPGRHVCATLDDDGSTEADLRISRGNPWAWAFTGFVVVLAAAASAGGRSSAPRWVAAR